MSGTLASGLLSETFPTDLATVPAARPILVLGDDGTRSVNVSIGSILDLAAAPTYTLPAATTTTLGGVLATAAVGVASNGGLILGQNGATLGQFLGWNGVAWTPTNAPSGSGTAVSYTFSPFFTVSGSSVSLKTGTDGSSVAIGNDTRFAANATAAAAAQTTANAAIPSSQKGVPLGVLASDNLGNLPLSNLSPGGATTGQVPAWNGTSWIPSTVGTGGSVYVLPSASTTVLGGVRFGTVAGTAADGGLLATVQAKANAALPAPAFPATAQLLGSTSGLPVALTLGTGLALTGTVLSSTASGSTSVDQTARDTANAALAGALTAASLTAMLKQIMPTLPKTQPSAAGALWLNNGTLSITLTGTTTTAPSANDGTMTVTTPVDTSAAPTNDDGTMAVNTPA